MGSSDENECLHCKSPTAAVVNSEKTPSKFGLYSAIGIGAVAFGFSIAAIPFLTPALRKHALPYIPATDKQISNVFKALKLYNTTNKLNYIPSSQNVVKLMDLGSGDGRIVFEAAKRGYQSTGVELNAMLYLYSKIKALVSWSNIKKSQICENPDVPLHFPRFQRANFWNIKMNSYDLIIVFGVQEMMADLAIKLKHEMPVNCLIVSCRSPIIEYDSIHHLDDELDSVWIYSKESLLVAAEKREILKKKKKPYNDDDDDDQI